MIHLLFESSNYFFVRTHFEIVFSLQKTNMESETSSARQPLVQLEQLPERVLKMLWLLQLLMATTTAKVMDQEREVN